ncbi:hypothetical protein [Arundinibacter roseus]|uniref:Uncharacterized protein n=1 Tax=Arundinibacter roseus TaxID=2070510 RepID=A0A4V2XA96_9BACT|nr:hypothetical protein [Arundinibacter roseus]TDB66835.1 hypothetical protein EZE20_06835 [Arundinibacter roseus]
MITVQEIGGFDQDTNAGFVRRIRLLRKQDVVSVMDPVRFPGYGPMYEIPFSGLIVKEGAQGFTFSLPPKTIRFSESAFENEQGLAFDTSFSFEIPKPSASLLQWLITHQQEDWVVLWEDYNDVAWISGNEEFGLRLQRSRTASGQNILLVAIQGSFSFPSFKITGFELQELFPQGQFSYHFGLHFNT